MPWYALQCNPRKEDAVEHQLDASGLRVYAPRLRVQPANPRARTWRPYFPGYLFVSVDLAEVGVSYFRHLPHAVGLVSFGGAPADVPAELLAAVERHLRQVNAAGGELFYQLQPGDRVVIDRGPFKGFEGIFDSRVRDSDRVRVLLDLIGRRQVALELGAGHVRPA